MKTKVFQKKQLKRDVHKNRRNYKRKLINELKSSSNIELDSDKVDSGSMKEIIGCEKWDYD